MMKRFAEFMDRKVLHDRVKQAEELGQMGITCRYLPDPPEDFDEYEFGIDYLGSQDRAVAVTIEKGEIKRMLFGATVPDNPDMLKPLSDEELGALLDRKGDDLVKFFKFITGS